MGTPSTGSLIAEQSLGLPYGSGGMNGVNTAAAALYAEIVAAVVAAGKTGGVSRRDLVERFAGRASESPLYRHITRAVRETGVTLAATKWPPRPRDDLSPEEQAAGVVTAKPKIRAVEEAVCRIEAASSPAPAVEAAAGVAEPMHRAKAIEQASKALEVTATSGLSEPPTDQPIDLAKRIHQSIADIDKIMMMAKREDGTVKNPRLAIVCVDLLGKTAERLARIQASLADQSQMGIQGCSTLWNGQDFKQVIDARQSSAVAVLAEGAALV